MKKCLLLALLIGLLPSQNVYAARVIPGSTCKKLNNQEVYRGKIYTCIKLGKKLYWNNGVKYATKPENPISTPSKGSPTPTPTPTPSRQLPLLRETDVVLRSTKLTVTWSGMGIDQTPFSNLRRINLWILEPQINPLVDSIWRVAGYIAPNPGASFEITLPNREHFVRISGVLLNGEETGYSKTIRVVPNPVQISKPTNVVAGWEKSDFKVKFTHNSAEEYLSAYKIRLEAGGYSKVIEIKPRSNSSEQIFVLNLQGNQSLFGVPQTVISGSVRTVDIFENEGEEVRFPAP